MVASTDIKFYVHSNNNAPQLQNAYGSMIGVLDACLVNGISLGQISSLTAIGTTVTAVFSTAHNLMQYQVLKITGANQAEYNGEHRILIVPNATSVTFQLASAPSVTTATGSITASLPPLGWEKPFGSANVNGGGKAAYRSKNLLLLSRPFLRVVDELDPAYTATYAKYAKVGIVEDMIDIDTMLGVQAPYDALNPNKNWAGTGSGASAINGWARWYYARSADLTSSTADAAAAITGNRQWLIVGDGDHFYVLPATITASTTALCYGFGSFKSLLSADGSNNFLSATLNYSTAATTYSKALFTPLMGDFSSQYLCLQRGYDQKALGVLALCVSLRLSADTVHSGSGDYIGATSLGAGIPLVPVFINESVLRGELKNLYWLYQNKPYNNHQVFTQEGVAYIAANVSSGNTTIGQNVLKLGDLNAA